MYCYKVNLNWFDYVVFYPEEGEEGYDGIHNGGIKGLRDDTPKRIRKQYERDMKAFEDEARRGVVV